LFPHLELKKAVADETVSKETVNTALTAAQDEYVELEQAAVAMCQELEEEGALSGSSVASRLRSLGGRVAEHAKSTFRLGVQRALAVASMHYDMDLQLVSSGYAVASGIGADAASAAMDDADAAVLAKKLENDISPIADLDAIEDPQGGEGNL
jgi:hypothetical protein